MRQLNFPPKSFPVLETAHLRLRELVPADAQAVYRLFSDEKVTQYYDFDAFTQMSQAEALIHRQAKRITSGEAIRWGITQRSNDIVIGTVGLVIGRSNASGGLGYDLASPYWRMGIMAETLTLITGYGFSAVNLNRIEALVMPENIASRRLLEKLNFTEEGLLRDYVFFKGKYQDMVSYSLLRQDVT
jgi:ribosomal-protein-alanine N-acetyltransferase